MARARRQPEETKSFSLRERISGIDDPSKDLIPLAKSYFVGEESGNQSNALVEQDRTSSIFTNAGAIAPIYEPLVLALIYENSSSLRQNVDAYVTNIDSFGHHFVPVLDLDADEADEKIRDAIRAENHYSHKASGKVVADEEPTDDEVKKKKEELRIAMRSELSDLEAFFANCSPNMPFAGPEGLRGLTRQDIEVFGYAYWEVLRNGMGEVSQFNKLESRSIRLMPIDDTTTDTTILRRVSSLKTIKVPAKKRFRNYIQRYEGSAKFVYYKEFGDPRLVSAQTGKVYVDAAAMSKAEKDSVPATEIIAFKITSVRSTYGTPRWVGAMLAVLGTRQAEEVNFLYFENRSIPPMAIIVSGGRLNKDAVKKLEDHIANQIRGKRNFHKILIIEGEASTSSDGTGPNNGKMKIELKPLTDSQQKDALFQEYDERNADKVGQTFRLPRLLRGDVRDFNRSCYSDDTETLTENGWKLQQDISAEEKIAAFNPETGEMSFVVPAKKLVYDVVEEPMFRFHNQQTDFNVTGDHKVLSRAVGELAWEIGVAAGLANVKRFEVPVAPSSWVGESRTAPFVLDKHCKIERGHKHPCEIDFNDWLEFLGYFISEGGLLTTDHPSAEFLVYIDQKKPEQLAKMIACLDRIGWQYSTQVKPCGTTHMLLSNRCLRKWLIENTGVNSHDKKIPNEYLNLGAEQLRVLFDALMTGDGSVDVRANRMSSNYASMSSELLGQVQRIALQLGFRASVIEPDRDNASVGRVCISTGSKTTQLRTRDEERTPSSLELATYTGKVYCFSVPGHGFFVTRRNGKVAIQGNTAEASIDFAEIQVFGPIRQQFDWMINAQILAELGIQYWTFKSNAPTVRDPEALAEMIQKLVTASVLTPEEARELARGCFNMELPKLKAEWTTQPVALTLAQANAKMKGLDGFDAAGGMSAGGSGATQAALGVDQTKSVSKGAVASALIKIEKWMLAAERQQWQDDRKEGEKLTIPQKLFDDCFVQTSDG